MTVAIVRESEEKIRSFILNFIKIKKLKLILNDSSRVLAGRHAPPFGVNFEWSIKDDMLKRGYKVNLKIESNKTLGLSIAGIVLLLIFLTYFSPLTGLIVLVVFLLWILSSNIVLEKDYERRFFSDLEKEFMCSIEKGSEVNFIPKGIFALVAVAALMLILSFALRIKADYLFYYLLAVFVFILAPYIVVALTGEENWRLSLASLTGYWSAMLSSIALVYLIYYYVWRVDQAIDSFSKMYPPMKNFTFILLDLVILIIMLNFFLIPFALTQGGWRKVATKLEPISIPDQAKKPKGIKLIFPRLTIVFLFILMSALNWIALLFVVDTASVIITGKVLFFKQIETLYLWLYRLRVNRIALPLIVLFCIPYLATISLFISDLLSGISRRLFSRDFEKQYVRIAPSLMDTVNKISAKHKIRPPKIEVIAEAEAICSSKRACRSTVKLSRGTLGILDLEEVKAVVIHEIYHLLHRARRLEICKLISRLGLLPNYYLALLFDLSNEEFEADKFVIEELGTDYAKYLSDALIKMDINNQLILEKSPRALDNTQRKSSAHRKASKFISLSGFIHGQNILGYIHPSIIQRIENLKSSQ